MNIVVVGLNYRTTPVEIREKVAFLPSRLQKALAGLAALAVVQECLILSTCNRVELYAITSEIEDGTYAIKRFVADFHQVDEEEIQPYFYAYSGRNAVRHLFRVASSLDSMVVGEPQILGQVKSAYSQACLAKTNALVMNRLLHRTFSVAKRVRSETMICSRAVSIPFAAVEMVQRIFGGLAGKKILLIGSGKIGELAAGQFLNSGVESLAVINRTLEHAESLAEKFQGRAVPLENLTEQLTEVDIVLSSTAAPHYIIRSRDMEKVISRRQGRPLFLIDIAVPRDIEPEVGNIPDVYLYDVDDLQGIISSNLQSRRKEADKAEAIIEAEVRKFMNWQRNLEIVPTIASLRKKVEAICRAEVAKMFAALPGSETGHEEEIETMASALVKKLLHEPIHALKATRDQRGGHYYAEALRYLFALEPSGGDNGAAPKHGSDDE
ncbi:MAG: glutamyl-tRNA reductase [Deltaproteobacteria bacterium]|nr:glutamyl-tRNA reductase [Deltaproteobacteria bacterium]